MASLWATFQNAGFFAYGALLCAMLAFVVSVVALIGTLASGRLRVWLWVAAAGLLFSGVGLSVGGLGTWLSRRKVDEALAGSSVDWSSLESIFVEGYREARDVSVVALFLLAVPLVVNGFAAALAAARARTSGGVRPKADLVVVALAGGFALLGAVSSLAGLPSSDETARSRAVALMKAELASFVVRSDCDPCEHLTDALKWRGAEQLEADVPGARERARKCIDDRLAVIQGGKKRFQKRCRADDLPSAPEPEETAQRPEPPRTPPSGPADGGELSPEADARARALREAAEFGMIGLLGGSPNPSPGEAGRKAELEALRDSPLLLDEAQKQKVAELIAEEEAKARRALEDGAAPSTVDPFGVGDGDRKKPTIRVGATTVNGRLPPEVIQRIVRQNYGRFRLCYEKGLRSNPKLEGRVAVRFVIGRDGSVSSVVDGGSDLPDAAVVGCVVRAFHGLSFPQPEGGIVTVSYPMVFSPGT